MKTKMFALLVIMLTLTASAFAQDLDLSGISQNQLDKPINEWQLNLTTLALIAMVGGRLFKAIRNGGGLVGAWNSLLYGTNVPKEVVKDYPELQKGKVGVDPALKSIAVVGALMLTLGFSGCASTATTVPPNDKVLLAADITRIAVSQIVTPVLVNNPKYEDALFAIAAGVDLAFAKKEITAEGINSFLDTVALKYEMDANTRVYVGAGLIDLLTLYKSRYGEQVASTTDPRLVAMLVALKDGIKTGISNYRLLAKP